ncbi:MAG: indole-3-glycerol phosphate synthase TrpC [Actinomycetota bacterium]
MSHLTELIDSTRRRVAQARADTPEDLLEERLERAELPRGFARALDRSHVALIAEIKRATPFKGVLHADLDAGDIAQRYATGGAAAISVLTEPTLFKGSIADLEAARAAGLPTLRKDFILDPYQVLESRAAGADAVLLIVRILDDNVADLIKTTEALGMDALVEVHDEPELRRAVDAGASLIGVNHRNLETGDVDPQRTAKLSSFVPSDALLVGLSGVSTRADVKRLEQAGARAVLVGEALVTAANLEDKLRELLGA